MQVKKLEIYKFIYIQHAVYIYMYIFIIYIHIYLYVLYIIYIINIIYKYIYIYITTIIIIIIIIINNYQHCSITSFSFCRQLLEKMINLNRKVYGVINWLKRNLKTLCLISLSGN